jgi:hypothetical protein
MRREIAGNSNEDVPTLSSVAPLRELSHAGLKHLIGMKARVLAQQGPPERRYESLRRVSKREMARDQPGCCIDLPLAVECIEQSGAERFHIGREVVQRLAGLARQPRRRQVEIAGEMDRHRAMEDGASGLAAGGPVGAPGDPLQQLVDGVGVGEDVVSGFPVAVLVGVAEPRDTERGRVGQRAAVSAPTITIGSSPSRPSARAA